MNKFNVSLAYSLTVDLRIKLGLGKIEGIVWEYDVGDFKFYFSGKEDCTVDGMTIGLAQLLILRNGWPVGLLSPNDGTFMGMGEDTEEDNFIQAIQQEIDKD